MASDSEHWECAEGVLMVENFSVGFCQLLRRRVQETAAAASMAGR